ncbi:MAG: diguanylate cyclase domain-containing protein, partial [Actinomycetota bacterium]
MVTTAGATLWSRAELGAFVGEANVFARTKDAGHAPLPGWLRPQPLDGADAPPRWDEQVSWIHLNDRPEVVRAWWQAVSSPGEPVSVRYRTTWGGEGWRVGEARYLNLLEHEVGAVLVVQLDHGPIAAPEQDIGDDATAQYDAPTWIIQYLDPVGAVIRTDGLVQEVFGQPPEALVGRNVLDVLHPDDHDAAIAMWLEVVAEVGATRTIRQRIVRPDGSFVWLESTVMNQLEQSGAVVAVSHDVSLRRQQEAALRASEQEFRTLAESVPAAVFRATADGTVTYANSLWYELTAPCGPVRSLLQLGFDVDLTPDEGGALERDIAAVDGRTLRLRCRFLPPGPEGPVVLGSLDDVTAEVARTDELRQRAERDALTGLVNRAGLERGIAEAMSRSPDDAALVFVDLDGFKTVNDTWGHSVGDAVLEQVARRLRSAVRPGDLVARYGG